MINITFKYTNLDPCHLHYLYLQTGVLPFFPPKSIAHFKNSKVGGKNTG